MRLIIVSNRSPINIVKKNDRYYYEESSGGLTSGLRSYVERQKKETDAGMEIVWVGWPGNPQGGIDDEERLKREIKKK